LISGAKSWPDVDITNTSGGASVVGRIDDLWHAALNGGGDYISAKNSDEVVAGLKNALTVIQGQGRSSSSPAVSSPEPVPGDDYAYTSGYTPGSWSGRLEARAIIRDQTTGLAALSPTIKWDAQASLDAAASYDTDTRTIYTWNGSARVPFTVANVNVNFFAGDDKNPNGALSQYASLASSQQSQVTPAHVISFLRGQNQFEMRTDGTHPTGDRVFRVREHVLGDIVDSPPTYMKKSLWRYADPGYGNFVAAQASRDGIVYVGANDGMLHAFDAQTGSERWAYVPRILHPTLYKLADANYADNHRYYVNGAISIGEVYDGAVWRTILIAGLGLGGKGYFALDITDPDNPDVLWEFSSTSEGGQNMGYSYGNPVIVKRAGDGKWVAVLTSGYNNFNTGALANEVAGDSSGHLFVLDAVTGEVQSDLVTTAKADANLSGIAKTNGWVLNSLVDNTAQYMYGGDLAGNLWRFDLQNESVLRLGQTSSSEGAQPITVRPELGAIRDNTGALHRIIYFGTGRYLGADDVSGSSLAEKNNQALYAVQDSGTDLGMLATNSGLIAQTLNAAATPRTIPSPQAVNWSNQNGWRVQLPLGERVNLDARLQLGTVAFVSNAPVDDYCTMGGATWTYALDYQSGHAVAGANNQVVFASSTAGIATGLSLILVDGRLVAIVRLAVENKDGADDGTLISELPASQSSPNGVRRAGYREIN
jgi:type IV pilus assembly protein PilY1